MLTCLRYASLSSLTPGGQSIPAGSRKALSKFTKYFYTNEDGMFVGAEPFMFVSGRAAGGESGGDDASGADEVDLTAASDQLPSAGASQIDVAEAIKSAVEAQMLAFRKSLVPVSAEVGPDPAQPPPAAASSHALRGDRASEPPAGPSVDVRLDGLIDTMRTVLAEAAGRRVPALPEPGPSDIGARIDMVCAEVKAVKQSLGAGLDRFKQIDALQSQLVGLRDIANRTYQSTHMTAMVAAHGTQSVAGLHAVRGAAQLDDRDPHGGHARWVNHDQSQYRGRPRHGSDFVDDRSAHMNAVVAHHGGGAHGTQSVAGYHDVRGVARFDSRDQSQYRGRPTHESGFVADQFRGRRDDYDHAYVRRQVPSEQHRRPSDLGAYEHGAYDLRLSSQHVRQPRPDMHLPSHPAQERVVYSRDPMYDEDRDLGYGRDAYAPGPRGGGQGGQYLVARRSPPRDYFDPGY